MKQHKSDFSGAFVSILYVFSKELIVEESYEILDNKEIHCLLTGFIKGITVSAQTDEEREAVMKCGLEYAKLAGKGIVLDKEFFDNIEAAVEQIEGQEQFPEHHNN